MIWALCVAAILTKAVACTVELRDLRKRRSDAALAQAVWRVR